MQKTLGDEIEALAGKAEELPDPPPAGFDDVEP